MSGNITFTMIKPEAVSDRYTGAITEKIEAAGFEIIAMKMTLLSQERAGVFYMVHKDRPFYSSLCDYMSSGKIIAMVLKKDNAVEDYRKLIGATDPAKAEDGTIRKQFAKSLQSNAVHGSDSDENAKIEAGFFFSDMELFST